MFVKLNGCEFEVAWGHLRFPHPRQLPQVPTGLLSRGSTFCRILDCASYAVLVIGWTHCSIAEPYSKQRGRKYALRHALALTDFSKEERRAFWVEYDAIIGLVKGRARPFRNLVVSLSAEALVKEMTPLTPPSYHAGRVSQ